MGLVGPTWPEQALRANIHAQISLALNRVYTEWYRSKGYNFQITSSTSYDQYYVHGRNIFEVMSRITDDIFNTYVRRIGTIDPYYTEYCDGKTVSCPGMKQWGTVTLANQGRNALSILQYYYGNNIEIVRTNNIQAIPESYPGTPLRLGSTGNAVRTIQRQHNRIARNYPFFGTLEVDGVFGASTEAVVKKFQKQFSLAQDGVVGRDTWYKISYIYVAVKKLAELSSEGEAATGNLVAGQWPGTLLRVGSRGDDVEQIQFWLNAVAEFVDTIPTVTVDGIFGQATALSTRPAPSVSTAEARVRSLRSLSTVSTVRWCSGSREARSRMSLTRAALVFWSLKMASITSQMTSLYRWSIRFSGMTMRAKSSSSASSNSFRSTRGRKTPT